MAVWVGLAWNLSALLLGVIIFLSLALLLRYRKNLPPGPQGWPIVGLLPKLLRMGLGDATRDWLSDLARKHDIYSLNIGGQLVVMVTQYTTIRAAFVNPKAAARPPSNVFADLKIFRNPDASGVAMASGAKWAELRMHVISALKGTSIGGRRFEEIILAEAEHFSRDIEDLKGEPFDPKTLLRKCTANVISTILLGRRFDELSAKDQSFLRCLHRFSDTDGFGSLLGMMPFMHKIGSLMGFKETQAATIDVIRFIQDEVRQHQETMDPDHPRDVIDLLLRSLDTRRRTKQVACIDSDDIVLTVFDLFLGGTETITSTVRWACLYLINHPTIMKDVQSEIEGVVGHSRVPCLANQSHLPFTCAVICESQRLGCVVPLVGPHFVTEDTTLFGFNVPRGAIVVGDFWNMSRDRATWKDSGDPGKFIPDRFLDEDGLLDKRDKQLNVFSRGRRLCPGENLAKMQLFLLLSNLLHRFNLSRPKGETGMRFKGDFKMTHAPKTYKLIATPRNLKPEQD